jgi:hypothetical protein
VSITYLKLNIYISIVDGKNMRSMLCLLFLILLLVQVFADEPPCTHKYEENCAILTNLKDFPEYEFYFVDVYEEDHDVDTPGPSRRIGNFNP